MSYALVFGALATLICVIGGIAALVWWIRRPVPQVRHTADQPLQLFSHARASVWMREEDEVQDRGASSELLAARAERQTPANSHVVPTWSLNDTTPAANGRRPPSGVPGAAGSAATFRRAAVEQPDVARYAPPDAVAEPHRERTTTQTAMQSATTGSNGSAVRFSVPTDATLQFLPGRLEILTGSDAGNDVRFVRLPGAATVDVTFGRIEGAPYRHVQLKDPTVSRQHATMHLRQGQWHLVNHSSTNPVVRNGEQLAVGEHTALTAGDRIEMGEVTFRFHA